MKHAYLIIAHNEPELFGVLVSLLDDVRNDIYVMVDGKVDIAPFLQFDTKHSKLVFLGNRISNYWGTYSLVKTELELFAKAYESGERYSYYHLLSGADLPIKTQDEIHAFCEQQRSKDGAPLEFLSFWEGATEDLFHKMSYHHPFQKYYRAKSSALRFVLLRVCRVSYALQRWLGCMRKFPDTIFKKGDQWASLSQQAVAELLNKRSEIKNIFEGSKCPDEIYKQTMLYASPLRAHIYQDGKRGIANLRAIDWDRGVPYVWQAGDLNELRVLPQLFARKFTLATPEGRSLVEELKEYLCPKQEETVA